MFASRVLLVEPLKTILLFSVLQYARFSVGAFIETQAVNEAQSNDRVVNKMRWRVTVNSLWLFLTPF